MTKTKTAPVPIAGFAHIGIRVHDLERSVRFYALLGFVKTAGPIGPEPVAICAARRLRRHQSRRVHLRAGLASRAGPQLSRGAAAGIPG
jgi:hypothetical protein